jgi:hypothetical protein
VCGHEFMLIGMAEDPDWVRDMVTTFSEFTIKHLEVLFAEEGLPDSIGTPTATPPADPPPGGIFAATLVY